MQVPELGRETCEVEGGCFRNGHFLSRRFLNCDFGACFQIRGFRGQRQLDGFRVNGRACGFLHLFCLHGFCGSRFGNVRYFDAVVDNGHGGRQRGGLVVRSAAFAGVQRDGDEI
jgi:hypothetical protein